MFSTNRQIRARPCVWKTSKVSTGQPLREIRYTFLSEGRLKIPGEAIVEIPAFRLLQKDNWYKLVNNQRLYKQNITWSVEGSRPGSDSVPFNCLQRPLIEIFSFLLLQKNVESRIRPESNRKWCRRWRLGNGSRLCSEYMHLLRSNCERYRFVILQWNVGQIMIFDLSHFHVYVILEENHPLRPCWLFFCNLVLEIMHLLLIWWLWKFDFNEETFFLLHKNVSLLIFSLKIDRARSFQLSLFIGS